VVGIVVIIMQIWFMLILIKTIVTIITIWIRKEMELEWIKTQGLIIRMLKM
jgi:hypothetical protein